jgi:hypothetical protein
VIERILAAQNDPWTTGTGRAKTARRMAPNLAFEDGGQCARAGIRAWLLQAVSEVDDAAAESMLVDELKIGVRVGRECGVALTEGDWPGEQHELVDHLGAESLYCEVWAADQRIPIGGGLQLGYRAGGEAALEPCVRSGRRGQGRGVDDLVHRLPSRDMFDA